MDIQEFFKILNEMNVNKELLIAENDTELNKSVKNRAIAIYELILKTQII